MSLYDQKEGPSSSTDKVVTVPQVLGANVGPDDFSPGELTDDDRIPAGQVLRYVRHYRCRFEQASAQPIAVYQNGCRVYELPYVCEQVEERYWVRSPMVLLERSAREVFRVLKRVLFCDGEEPRVLEVVPHVTYDPAIDLHAGEPPAAPPGPDDPAPSTPDAMPWAMPPTEIGMAGHGYPERFDEAGGDEFVTVEYFWKLQTTPPMRIVGCFIHATYVAYTRTTRVHRETGAQSPSLESVLRPVLTKVIVYQIPGCVDGRQD
ncbi:hypothetical protein HW532_14410 [Kaustia mangrovi]|uniref:Uncharacterized protein n=1 Tax=Kaustia mangrovi TaxID=2593653 RepID=A0A7S8C5I8_9HYPH|nr:hypothetical protein [Kaustia mangrovi]QPC43773.1 hypothetical protein HW532_14410 [Kaustia mangrovi]